MVDFKKGKLWNIRKRCKLLDSELDLVEEENVVYGIFLFYDNLYFI